MRARAASGIEESSEFSCGRGGMCGRAVAGSEEASDFICGKVGMCGRARRYGARNLVSLVAMGRRLSGRAWRYGGMKVFISVSTAGGARGGSKGGRQWLQLKLLRSETQE